MKKIFLGLLIASLAASANAITFVGTFQGDAHSVNSPSSEFLTFLSDEGLSTDIDLFIKDSDNDPTEWEDVAFSSLHDSNSGVIPNYTGSLSIVYIAFKAGTNVAVYEWMVNGGPFNLLDDAGIRQDVSHIDVFTSDSVRVPDSGTTLALLGLALAGLGFVARRRK